jgi:adenine-specific DNA-methyltransferase
MATPSRKSFLCDVKEGVTPVTIWPHEEVGHNHEANNELKALLGNGVFDNPKPTRLIRRMLELGAATDGNSVVLDFFAGSGTTGHAVMAQNAADGCNRRFILVQLPEPLDPDNKDQKVAANYCDELKRPRNISELTKERLRRAARKIKQENPMFSGDLGFRVFKLDSSNIRAWESDREHLDQTLLDSVEHLKEGRTDADVLYELLLKRGLDMCAPIETRTIAGKEVHAVGGGVLIACLSETITREDVEALAQFIVDWHMSLSPAGDTVCLFRDGAFIDDVAKTNLAAILSQNGLNNMRSV